ncbi:restriction endonuclease [Halothiobacillus diazotrophicus]|uniref:Restriction endonuclease n=1 Tax=Halothiobacillus diazotrophicus TaxID=1860122 RepID=A0A191ZJ32_9GAMM|nr:restriction endonuclease [Halothiobacillus diazotrophicus]ANJ67880.1 restriction endonuclease [Halothiobacillus diazotrophicus]
MGKGITRERTGLLLQTLFHVLLEHPDGIAARDAIDAAASRLQLTEHEAGAYETGGRRFDKILRFATVDAVKAGWMTKSKGTWSITEIGQEALITYPKPEAFYREASRLYWKWRRSTPVAATPEEPEDERDATITFEEAEEQAWKEIVAYLENIDPYDLQDMVAALLEAMGYHVNWVSPPGKDAGLDIVAYSDPLGTKPPRIKVQVKRRKDTIGVEELRSFLALINEDDVGIFVTTGGFSKDATDLARHQERRRVTLINRQRLVDLWIEYQDQVVLDKRDALPLRPIYFLAPAE